MPGEWRGLDVSGETKKKGTVTCPFFMQIQVLRLSRCFSEVEAANVPVMFILETIKSAGESVNFLMENAPMNVSKAMPIAMTAW